MLEDITITKALEFAVMTEEQAASVYEKLAGQFADDADLKAVFDQLAKDEHAHRQQFALLLEQTPEDEGTRPAEDLEYLRAMSVSEFFGDTGPLAGIDAVADKNDALMKVLSFERTALGYYRAISDVLGDSAALDGIIAAERAHVRQILKYLIVDGSQFRGLGDTWT
jgi:rubrerythrin